MDLITAALLAYTKTIELIILNIESQPPALRAEIATRLWEEGKPWRAFLDKLFQSHS